jgi:hypothetical protein
MGAEAPTDGSWVDWRDNAPSSRHRADTCDVAKASVSRTEVKDGSNLPFLDLV